MIAEADGGAGRLRQYFVAILSMAVLPLVAHAQTRVYDEYAIKAAYVYNLSKFVEWPPSATKNQPFTICVYGRDPYGQKIDAVSERTTQGRPISIVRRDHLTEANCEIAFVGQSETYRLEEAIAFFANSPVLTIGESADFVDKGGIVALVASGKRITFEINLGSANTAGLVFSAQLLRVATRLVE